MIVRGVGEAAMVRKIPAYQPAVALIVAGIDRRRKSNEGFCISAVDALYGQPYPGPGIRLSRRDVRQHLFFGDTARARNTTEE